MPRPKKQLGGSELWVEDVNKMYDKYGMFDWVKMKREDKDMMKAFLKYRINHISEEKKELDDALANENAEEIVDAMIDICVLSIGTLQLFGVNAKKAWDEVLRANITKERGIKPGRPNPYGLPDLMKPEGWKGPDHSDNHGLLPKLFEKTEPSEKPEPSRKSEKVEVDDAERITQSITKALTQKYSTPVHSGVKRTANSDLMFTPTSRFRVDKSQGTSKAKSEGTSGGKRKSVAKK